MDPGPWISMVFAIIYVQLTCYGIRNWSLVRGMYKMLADRGRGARSKACTFEFPEV